jgi:hypothetical protein
MAATSRDGINASKVSWHAAAAVPTSTARDQDQAPLDLQIMRESALRVLGPDDSSEALPHTVDELDTLALALRGHLQLILAEVERAAGPRPSSAQSYCALACIGEARRRLGVTPHPALQARVAHARLLARCLNALCDHYERLSAASP